MYKYLIVVTLLFGFLGSKSQSRDSVLVSTNLFTIMYSEKFEQPLWIRYEVKCSSGNASRAGMDFYTNDSIHTSDNLDYANNVYDKGHLAPAADFNCDKQTLFKTFSYLNCALQNQYLNRGVWRLLEIRERELSKTQKITVYIKIDFGNETLKSGARVPSGFYKEIKGEKLYERYYFKNEKPTYSDFNKYKLN